jgi:hypothetical protein
MIAMLRKAILTGIFCLLSVGNAMAVDVLQPFVLAYTTTGDVGTVASDVRGKLTGAGFDIVGEYSPYDGADVIVVTTDALKSVAARSERGGYGAVQRIAVTKNGNDIEVTYTNPVFMAAAYRMNGDLADVRTQLEGALGAESDFGSKERLTAEDLHHYEYMKGYGQFDEPSKLVEYDSHAVAVKAVEDALAAGYGGATKVYRIDIPGKDETVFGVALKGVNSEDCSSDEYIMSRIDKITPRHTAHLPYEILVNDAMVEALYARFRIAINWPSLHMLPGFTPTFFSIMCAPDDIEEALTKASGGEKK